MNALCPPMIKPRFSQQDETLTDDIGKEVFPLRFIQFDTHTDRTVLLLPISEDLKLEIKSFP
jgi:hypothetical protein